MEVADGGMDGNLTTKFQSKTSETNLVAVC